VHVQIAHHDADTSQRAVAEAELARLNRTFARLDARADAYADATTDQWLRLAAEAIADAARILEYELSGTAYETYVAQAENRLSAITSRMDALDAQVLTEGRRTAARVSAHGNDLGRRAPRRAHDLIADAEDAVAAGDRAARAGRPGDARSWYAHADRVAQDAARIASAWHAEQARVARLDREYTRSLASVEASLARARAGFTGRSPVEAERQAEAALARMDAAEAHRARGDLDGALAELERAMTHADAALAQVARTHRDHGTQPAQHVRAHSSSYSDTRASGPPRAERCNTGRSGRGHHSI
jgi:hypothetical protein